MMSVHCSSWVTRMSSRANRFSDQAFVLHSRKYRNTSLIVEAFTREHGRIGLVAKGARQGKSPLYSVLQPFSLLFLSWGGHGELTTLYTAELAGNAIQLKNDTVYSGLYLNELLMRLLHKHDAHPELFHAYERCVTDISSHPNTDLYLRYFEADMLESLGYGLNLISDAHSGEPVREDREYAYLVEQGPILSDTDSGQSLRISGAALLGLQARDLSDMRSRKQAKFLLRAVLDFYLGDTPLKTRELVKLRSKLHASTTEND